MSVLFDLSATLLPGAEVEKARALKAFYADYYRLEDNVVARRTKKDLAKVTIGLKTRAEETRIDQNVSKEETAELRDECFLVHLFYEIFCLGL